jgi:hypothetical protein
MYGATGRSTYAQLSGHTYADTGAIVAAVAIGTVTVSLQKQ